MTEMNEIGTKNWKYQSRNYLVKNENIQDNVLRSS
jgi:hypothetical protein